MNYDDKHSICFHKVKSQNRNYYISILALDFEEDTVNLRSKKNANAMTNNEIFRRLRYLFEYNDAQIVELFEMTDFVIEEEVVINWLRSEDDPLYKEISDRDLAIFLNGVIIEKRGKREGPSPQPEDILTNNIIFRKLKIALNLRSDDILETFAIVDRAVSPHELSAFFRDPGHAKYRECMDQYLRNFMNGLLEQKKRKLKEK